MPPTPRSRQRRASTARPPAARKPPHLKEREQFHLLLLENPNYFGTAPELGLPTKLELSGNTAYEEITCLGYNQRLDLLEATVQIKQPTGYGGNLCSAGSTEFVRFYVDYGGGWEDLGLGSFQVHDIPSGTDCAGQATKPLSYVVSIPFDPRRTFCWFPQLPAIRAVLSWQSTPPPGTPDWPQVWGNTVDRHIQITPRPPILIEVLKLAVAEHEGVELPEALKHLEEVPIEVPPPPPPELAVLAKRFGGEAHAKKAIEPHRFGFEDIHPLLASGFAAPQVVAEKSEQWKALGLDLAKALAALESSKGNVAYEELTCLGLDRNREWLVANVTVKQSTGYSGSLCERGSQEYVAFWADWDDTCEWTYLDTRAIDVHDIAGIPPDGLQYEVALPVDLSQHRRGCAEPKVGRIRAVLSWASPPSTTDPDLVPYWGNRLDAHVEIKPGGPVSLAPQIQWLGGIGVGDIDVFGNGMTKPNTKFAESGAWADPYSPVRLCPFGGRIQVQAQVPAQFAANGWQYRVMTRKYPSGPPIPVTTPFVVSDGWNPPVTRTPNATTGYIGYLLPQQNGFNMLGYWETRSLGDDLWYVWLELANGTGNFLGGTIPYLVQLDNTAPETVIHIDSGGDCKDFAKGTQVDGHFVARDVNFGHFSLRTLPASQGPPNPTPSSGISQTAPTPGDPWNLPTGAMNPCGYVVLLEAWDRAIVNSQPGAHNYNANDVGFCLRAS